jgi:pimeloyl-ACP methyl ester carboxylesterase
MYLLLHGALGHADQLKALADRLAPEEVRCIDLAGHGQQRISGKDPSFEDFLLDIDSAMGGREDVHLVGYSMGGYAALLHAARYPGRVRSVITLGTKLEWDREGLDRELRMLDPEKMKEKVPQFVAELAAVHGAEEWADLVHATARLITGLHERPLLTAEALEAIRCPVLLCVGDRDRTAVPEHTLAAAARIPKGAALVLPGTPHPFAQVDLGLLTAHMRAFHVRG